MRDSRHSQSRNPFECTEATHLRNSHCSPLFLAGKATLNCGQRRPHQVSAGDYRLRGNFPSPSGHLFPATPNTYQCRFTNEQHNFAATPPWTSYGLRLPPYTGWADRTAAKKWPDAALFPAHATRPKSKRPEFWLQLLRLHFSISPREQSLSMLAVLNI
jgi:hypothetical protein